MTKRLITLLFSISLILTLVGCGNKLDAETTILYSNKAQEAIQLLIENELDSVFEQFDETMKAQLSKEQMEQVTSYIDAAGEFEATKKSAVQEKDGYYIVVTVAEFSKENRVFTITYNQAAQIAGLYVR